MEIPREDLERAATYRVLALFLLPPSLVSGEELRTLTQEIPGEPGDKLRALAEAYSMELEGLYHKVLGPTGVCRDAESDFEVNALGGKGPLLADVSGFYKAFAYEVESVGPLAADHVSVELDYLAWMAFKTAYARHCEFTDSAETCSVASEKFVKEHLGAWARAFVARLAEAAEGTFYEQVALVLAERLETFEPGRIAAQRPDLRRGPGLPVLSDNDECCDGPATFETN